MNEDETDWDQVRAEAFARVEATQAAEFRRRVELFFDAHQLDSPALRAAVDAVLGALSDAGQSALYLSILGPPPHAVRDILPALRAGTPRDCRDEAVMMNQACSIEVSLGSRHLHPDNRPSLVSDAEVAAFLGQVDREGQARTD